MSKTRFIGITTEVFGTQKGDLTEQGDDGPGHGLFDVESAFTIREITEGAIGLFDGVDEGSTGDIMGAIEKILKQRGIGEGGDPRDQGRR